MVSFRTGLHVVSFQMSRSVETCLSGCQNYSFSNTQDTLVDILTGILLEHEQDGDSQFARRRKISKRMPDRWEVEKPSIARKSQMGACSLQKCMSSETQAQVKNLGREDRSSHEK